jgi:cytochrome P450
MRATQETSDYVAGQIEDRKTYPADDLISMLMNANGKSGQPLSDAHRWVYCGCS